MAAVVTMAGLGLSAVPASAACGIAAPLDLDGDCASEATEEAAGTDAWDPDTDDDRLSDGYELSHGSDPLAANSNADRFVRALLTDLGIPVTEDLVDQHTPAATTSQGRSTLVRNLAYSETYVRSVVDRFYRDTLDRGGDPRGVAYWTGLLSSKQVTTAQAAGYFYASDEYFENAGGSLDAWLVDLYGALLLRAPDAGGFAHWKGVAQLHGRAAVAIPFYQAIETRRLRVRHLYHRFLHRSPDKTGEEHWADVLLRTGDDVDLAVSLATSPEYSTRSTKRRWGTFGPEPPPVRIRRVPSASGPRHGATMLPSISEDGQYVAYLSGLDVFLWNRLTNETTTVSEGHDGGPSDAGSWFPVVSGDGSHVAFLSEASNLVPGETSRDWSGEHFANYDVFVWSRTDGTTERVSVTADGALADGPSDFSLDISHDGRFVVFTSYATNLDPEGDDDEFADIFVRDRAASTTEQISRSNEEDAVTHSLHATISDDGRYVAFSSMADDLVPDDGNDYRDVFLADRSTDVVSRISAGAHPGPDGHSDVPRISGDSRYVAFTSGSAQLVPEADDGVDDIFVWERETGAFRRVTIQDAGATADHDKRYGSISRDGRFVAFTAIAPDLPHGLETGDIYLWDALTGTSALVSRSRSGESANGVENNLWDVSGDGRFVVFDSDASNLVPGDDNEVSDIFLWEHPDR